MNDIVRLAVIYGSVRRGLVTTLACLAWWARSLREARAVRNFADAVSLD